MIWRQFTRNSAGSLTATLTTSLVGFVLSVILSRSLGAEQYGQYAYAMFLVGTLSLILGFGIPPALNRFVAEAIGRGDHRSARRIVRISLATLLAASLGTGLLALLVSAPATRMLGLGANQVQLFAIWLVLIPAGLVAAQRATFASLLRMDLYAAVVTVPLLARLTLYAILIRHGASVTHLIYLEAGIQTGTAIVLALFLRRQLRPPIVAPSPTAISWRSRFVHYAAALALVTVLDYVVWTRSEVYFIERLRSSAEVAYYTVATTTPTMTMSLLPAAIGMSVTPLVARKFGTGDVAAIRSLFVAVERLTAIIVFPLAVGGCLLASQIISVIYGPSYHPAVYPMQIAFLASIVISLLGVASAVLYGIGAPGFAIKIGIVLLPVSIVLNIVFISRFGITGAAIANMVTQTGAIPITVREVTTRINTKWPLANDGRIMGAVGAMAVVVLGIRQLPLAPVVLLVFAVVVGAITYLVGLLATRAITSDERRYALRSVRRALGRSLGDSTDDAVTSTAAAPTVSVIIPTKGRGVTILPCIASVTAQSQQPLELIVVDQNSDNEISAQLHEIVELTSIRLIHVWRPDIRGLAEARNVGFDRSRGEIILFLDDDVVLDPHYIEGILTVYEADVAGKIGGVGGCITNEVRPREWLDRFWHGPFYDGRPKFQARPVPYFKTNALSGSNMSYRRPVFDMFRTDESLTGYSFGEDWELGVRISRRYELVLTDKALLEHRHSPLHRLPEPELLSMIMRNRHAFFLKLYPPMARHRWRTRAALAWYRIGMALFAVGAARVGKMRCAQTVLRELWRQTWNHAAAPRPPKHGGIMRAIHLAVDRRLPIMILLSAAALTGIFGLASGVGLGLYLLALAAVLALMVAIVLRPLIGTAVALIAVFCDPVHPIDPNQSLLNPGRETKLALIIWLGVIGAAMVGTILATLQNREPLITTRSATIVGACALAAVGTLSLPFADNTHQSALRLIPMWVGVAVVWMIGQNARTPAAMRALAIVMALASIANGALGQHGLRGTAYETGIHRLAGVVGDPNFLALQLGMVLFFLPVAFRKRKPRDLIAVGALGGVLLSMIGLTVSRGALAALAAAALVAFIFCRSGKIRLLIIVVACVGVLFVFHSMFERRFEVRAAAGDSNGRTAVWSDAVAVWANHPLLGVGVGNYVDAADQQFNRVANATHDIFLESLTELGIVGFFLFAISIGMVVVRTARAAAHARAPTTVWCLLSITFGLTAALFLDPLFFAPFWVALGLVDRWLTLTVEQPVRSPATHRTTASLTLARTAR